MAELLQRMPPNMPMLQYPDTCHPIKGQYPVPWMHWAFAFTYGRSAINPTPHQHGAIVKLRQKEPYDHRLRGWRTALGVRRTTILLFRSLPLG